jgi:hypothetical protein
MAKNYIDYIYLDTPSDYPEDLQIIVFEDEDSSLLKFEMCNCDLPYEWKEELNLYPSGYYKLEYDYCMDSESVDGYKCYEYAVLSTIVSVKPSFIARLIELKLKSNLVYYMLLGLFTKCWKIDYYYGSAGLTSKALYLPQALWLRFIAYRWHDAGWGMGYKPKLNLPYPWSKQYWY